MRKRSLEIAMKAWLHLLLILVLFTTAVQSFNIDSRGGRLGPLPTTGQTPLQTLRLDIVPTRYDILAPGQTEFSLFNSWTNRWNRSYYYHLDVEVLRNQLEYNYGIGSKTEIGIILPFITRTGGYLDSFIVGFHESFGLDQSGRREYPENQLEVSFLTDSGEEVVILDKSDQGTIVGDLSLISRSNLYSGTGLVRSVIFSTLFRLPTSQERSYLGSSGIDGAFSISSSFHPSPFYLYGTIGYGMFGSGNLYGINLRPYQWTFFMAVEYPVSENSSLILQQLSNSGMTVDSPDFSSPTHELTFGVRHWISSKLMLHYGLVENLYVFNNSIDFGLLFGLTWRP